MTKLKIAFAIAYFFGTAAFSVWMGFEVKTYTLHHPTEQIMAPTMGTFSLIFFLIICWVVVPLITWGIWRLTPAIGRWIWQLVPYRYVGMNDN